MLHIQTVLNFLSPRIVNIITGYLHVTVLCIGDPHFKINNGREMSTMVEKTLSLARELRPTFIVCLGDILDRHETINVRPLCQAMDFLRELSLIAPLKILIGNHDRENNSDFLTPIHPFTGCKKWPSTVVADTTIEETISGHKFVFVPYVPPGKLQEAMAVVPQPLAETTAVFMHQEVKGAKMGAVVSTVGDPWPSHYPLGVSGHVHDYDRLAENFYYTGTPIQVGFGDKSKKTVSVYQFSSVSSLFVPRDEIPGMAIVSTDYGVCPGTAYMFMHQRVSLELPRKEIWHLSTEELAQMYPSQVKDKDLKIIVSGTQSQIAAVKKLETVIAITALVKVAYKMTLDNEANANISNTLALTRTALPAYKTVLLATIQANPVLVQAYQSVFG